MWFDPLTAWIVSLFTTGIPLAKEKFTPTIPAENWANKDLIHQDRMNGMSEKQILENVKNGRYIVTEKYPEPHRNEHGQIMIENYKLYNEDLLKYGAVQTMKWVKQGKYNLEGEALKKEQERIEKHFEELMNLRKK